MKELHRRAVKSLARRGRKQAAATKLRLLRATQKKKFRRLSIQSGLCGSSDLRVGRKMATFQLFFHSDQAKDLSAPLYYMVCHEAPVNETSSFILFCVYDLV